MFVSQHSCGPDSQRLKETALVSALQVESPQFSEQGRLATDVYKSSVLATAQLASSTYPSGGRRCSLEVPLLRLQTRMGRGLHGKDHSRSGEPT